MSSITGAYGPSSFGMLGRLIGDNAAIRKQVDRLSAQAGSGLVSDRFAGLGAGAGTALVLRPHLMAIRTWQDNIDAAALRMDVAQSAMKGIQDTASKLLAQLNTLNGLNPSMIDSAAAGARQALTQVAHLLNSEAAGAYVFAGTDTANPPIPAAEAITASGFFTQIQAAVAGLSVNGAAATAATTWGVAISNAPGTSPFSAYLSQPVGALQRPVVETGPNQAVPVGLLASANAAVPSAPPATTGSYMRDVMRALATIGSLSAAQANDPGLAALMQDTRASLTGAISAMAADAGVLGDTQSTLARASALHGETEVALSKQLSTAEDVDMARTLSDLSLVQTQLQASYQLIVNLNSLSLTKFLG